MGWTQIELSKLALCSKGHLSRIESGLARPNQRLAKRLDDVLGANGELAAKVSSAHRVASPVRQAGTWDLAEPPPAPAPSADLEDTAVALRTVLDEHRRLGNRISSRIVLGLTKPHTTTSWALARAATVPELAREWWLLAACSAEHSGLMEQEAGDDDAAMRWTKLAVDCAEQGGHPELASYLLVRQAEIALYRQQPETVIKTARQAQDDKRSPARVRCLAAQREAQGHGLAGNYDACLRALDNARRHQVMEEDDDLGWGATGLRNPIDATAGWALYDLGRLAESVRILEREVPLIPADSARTKVRFGVRHALALVECGNVDDACRLLVGLLRGAQLLESATIRSDLIRLRTILSRWSTRPAVRDLKPALLEALVAPERIP
jgi:transcriptional regulator with XRE-family HTH domain